MPMTEERLAEIKRVTNAATPPPWRWDTYNSIWAGPKIVLATLDHPQGENYTPTQIAERTTWYDESRNNIRFAELSRTAIPELIAALREAQEAGKVFSKEREK